jgi:hypothetical protein
MKTKRFGMTVCLLLSMAGRWAEVRAAAPDCDRACLNGFVGRYLGALVAHDPSRLPLVKGARYTENGQVLKLGDGMWGVANRVRDYKLYFADPAAGQVGFFGVIEENGHPQITALRLKIDDHAIAGIEVIVARKEGPQSWPKPDDLVDHPIFRQPLLPGERRSREELVRIANSYFEGLEQSTARLTPFDPQCTRVENGNMTANNPGGSGMQKMTCAEQFATGFSRFITRVRERRFTVVDEERGLVYAQVFFDHAGMVTTVQLTNGETLKVPPPYDTPYTWQIGELFKIQDGRITRIEAVLVSVPYGMPSGWAK